MSKTIRISFIAFIVALVFGCMCTGVHADSSKLTDEYYIISETQNEIAPGIIDKRIVINNADGTHPEILHVCEVDLSVETTGFLAGYPDYDPSKVKMDTPTNQALAAEKATGENVVVAVNNNLFSLQDGSVMGTLIMNGKKISGANGDAYFGCTADNTPLIGVLGDSTPALKEAVGGFRVLVKDGKALYVRGDGNFTNDQDTTRNAVGIKADGKVIYMVTEGKDGVFSMGIDTYDIAEIMVGLGCVDVMQPDGGGSSTYAVKYPGSSSLSVENDPSYGAERMVSATLLITSSAKSSGTSSFTKCQKNGHTYVKTNNTVKCSVCGDSCAVSSFYGIVTDKASGKKMYYVNGVYQTGWTPVDQDIYYFNSKGLSETVTVKSTTALKCTENGYTVYYCSKAMAADGKEYTLPVALRAPGHAYNENRICKRCGWKEVNFNNCTVTTKYASYIYTGKEIKPKVVVKSNGTTLNDYYDYKIIGYENNIDYGTGKIYINTNFQNGADLVDNTSSLERQEDPYVVTFQIKPAAVTNLKATTMGTNSVKLSWTKTADATGYQIRKYNPATGKYELKLTIKNPNNTSWTFKKLAAGKAHTYRVFAVAKDSDGNTVTSNYKQVKVATKPMQVLNVKLSKVNKTTMKVKWNKRECTGYQIRYSTYKNFKSYKQVQVVGKANVTKKLTSLKKGKRYYVKVRAYTTVNNVKTFGAWSNAKNIKIK